MTIRKHLESRFYDVNLHSAVISGDESEAYFMLFNLSGQIVGYQKYNPEYPKGNNIDSCKYYIYLTKIDKKTPVAIWGMESWSFTNTLFVCEGVFDAARLTWAGASAVAICSNDLSPSLNGFLSMVRKFRPVVAVTDDDDAGQKLAKAGHLSYTTTTGKDMGEADQSEVEYVINKFGNM